MKTIRRSIPAVLAVAAVLAAAGCQTNVPLCANLSPVHATQDGRAVVGATLRGDTVDDVIVVQTAAVEGAPVAGHTVIYEIVVDPDCDIEMDCGPDTVDIGTDIRCSVTDAEEGPACSWSIELGITITQLDSDICRDITMVFEATGDHTEAIPGR